MRKGKITSIAISVVMTSSIVCTLPVRAAENISYNYVYDLANGYIADNSHTREMEGLNRGLVAVNTSDGVYLSWRLFDSEDTKYGSAAENVSFDIYRDGEKIATESGTTNYLDKYGDADSKYYVLRTGESPLEITDAVLKTAQTGSSVTVNAPKSGLTAYAAKYSGNGALEKIAVHEITSSGTNSFNVDFEPDRVFLWDGMQPVTEAETEQPTVEPTPRPTPKPTPNIVIPNVVTPLANNYFDIPLTKPAAETITDSSGNSRTYSFSPADCSVGDVDGDGEYEIIVKFTSNECDVGNGAYSGTVRFNAYKLDGTRLWENDINLGRNVFSSAHTAQFLVYDFDGDGKAEMTVQTSLGSTDATGNYVSKASEDSSINSITDEENASADYREANNGRITMGEEFLTIFDGETGEAIDTIVYPTARYSIQCWGKNDGGNRSQRFLAAVAYLDGQKPYAVYWRGYYDYGSGRTGISGVSFDGEHLSVDYQFDTLKGQPGYHAELEDYSGQGNHSMTSADVDNDGKDEIISGALCLEVDDNNVLMPKWCSWREHGDAHHIGDYDPTNPGLEYFSVHEHDGQSHGKTLDFGMTVYDAATGEELFHAGNSSDTGRGMMANVGSGGYYQITGAGTYMSNGGTDFTRTNISLSNNFRIFWDGDLYDELLNGTSITSWNGKNMATIFTASGCNQINGTKANPSLQADLFGDWREEVVYPTNGGNSLRVFTTTDYTNYKIKTLMHDPVYRMGVASEQTCYNQPPHVGFYMDEEIFASELTGIEITKLPDITRFTLGEEIDTMGLSVKAYYADDTEKIIPAAACTISGYDKNVIGEQTVTVTYREMTDTFAVTVSPIETLTLISLPLKTTYTQGQQLYLTGLELSVSYSDGFSKAVNINNCEVTGFDSSVVGTCTVTITYFGQSVTLDVEIEELQGISIPQLNNEYVSTDTSTTNSKRINIGNYSGDFTLEHAVTINSMPANGSNNRRDDNGFFFRFRNGNTYGGGWYFMPVSENETRVSWKTNNAVSLTPSSTLKVNETYKFVYAFHNVGIGTGASVDITIYDSEGNIVGIGTGLDMRNMTSPSATTTLTEIEIFNQARTNSTSSVTIDGAVIIQQ